MRGRVEETEHDWVAALRPSDREAVWECTKCHVFETRTTLGSTPNRAGCLADALKLNRPHVHRWIEVWNNDQTEKGLVCLDCNESGRLLVKYGIELCDDHKWKLDVEEHAHDLKFVKLVCERCGLPQNLTQSERRIYDILDETNG